jgi:hypothetical protein
LAMRHSTPSTGTTRPRNSQVAVGSLTSTPILMLKGQACSRKVQQPHRRASTPSDLHEPLTCVNDLHAAKW